MEETSQLGLVVAFAAVLLVSGQLFMEHRPKAFDGPRDTTAASAALNKGKTFTRVSSARMFQGTP